MRMIFWTKYLMGSMILMDKAGDPPAGGAGDPPAAPPTDPEPPKGTDDLQAQVKNLISMNEKLMAQLKGGTPPEDPEPNDLSEKARLERESKAKDASSAKGLESAIEFNMKSNDWLNTNEALLPESIKGIFEAAEKENYSSQVDKASAIKSAIVSEFFAVQDNLDLLTQSQKEQLANFSKLTKNEREQRVQSIYDNLFEPTFEGLKRMRKASQVQKGHGDQSDSEAAYIKKLTSISRKKYMGDK